MRQEGSFDERSIQIAVGFPPDQRVPAPSRDQASQKLKEKRNDEDRRHERARGLGSLVETPTGHQQHQTRQRRQAAAQVIENLPPIDPRQGIRY